ncbi:hypothetical protein BJF79_03445 [Actinomadura sp. CNU-125]|uniref:MarR family transcriptional regulator n=1 Tax=Actinomadura sp. CNU-125 TaxID=1904961 RepID=UPI000960A9CF|nr:MarR family transcriptional regulator [Actinomadura sp. CNU-125]OLT12968.1 hypothetical protein BJF79_03445 [Actinomadura sp. CNU-125]
MTATIIGDDAATDRYTAIPIERPTEASGTEAPRSSRWDVEGTIARTRTDVYDTAVRLRAQIGPHAAVGATVGAGLALDAIVATGGLTPGSAAMMAAAASAATVGAIVARARRRGSEWVQRMLIGGAGAGLWLTAAPYGVGLGDAAMLVAGEYALAARWWQANRPGYPDADCEADDTTFLLDPEDIPEPLTPVEQIISDWDEYIACAGGPLHNSRLIAPQEHEHGFAFTLQLWRGRQTLATALAALDKLAGGLGYGVDQVIVEQHPAFKSTATCKFQLITRSPISGDIVFTGPRRRGGLLELGPYADGSGEAVYRLYTPGSMWSGVVIGGTGIGKSRVVENIVISALSGGDTEFWYLDPARGGSSPALADAADWFVTMDQIDEFLDTAIAELDARAEENAVEGWTGFTPSPQRPGLLIAVEECHNPFADNVRAVKWARLAREGRKLGIALLCVSQYPGLITFGSNEALRSSVMEGNALVLRSTSNQTGGLMAGLTVDPKTLPKIPGYAYVQGSEETGVRTAPFRNRNTEPAGGPGAAYWLAQQPRPGLDTLMVTATLAAGTAYRDRHTSTDTGRAGSRARVEALRNGHVPADMLRGEPEDTAVVPLADIVGFPEFRLIKNAPETTAATPSAARPVEGLTPSQQSVLDAVSAGIDRPRLLEERVGLKHRQIQNILRDLLDAGLITKAAEHGRYQRAA